MADKAKLISAALVMTAAIVAFYYFDDQALWIRVLGIVALAAVSVAIAAQAELGRTALGYVKEANIEVRKVVWPTRKETTQTTLIVMAMVIVLAIFLWLLDMFLLWAVRLLTG